MEKESVRCTSEYENKVAILDFDTVIPTAQIYGNKDVSGKHVTIDELETIGKMVHKLLLKYITLYGRQNIFIVTNATRKWVNLSLDLLHKMYSQHCVQNKSVSQDQLSIKNHSSYFEAIKYLLTTEKINILSAKDLFEKKYPNQTIVWKTLAFAQIISSYCVKYNKNVDTASTPKYSIISIGPTDDFIASYKASEIAKKTCKIDPKNIILHRIKLKSSPSISEMTDQIGLILALADTLYNEISISQTIDYHEQKLNNTT